MVVLIIFKNLQVGVYSLT